MTSSGIPRFVLLAATAFLFAGCQDARDPLVPAEAQFAKAGKPSQPVDGGGAPKLLEYYVYQEGGSNFVHVVGEGDVFQVNVAVVQDYVFNGARDDDYDTHYEYSSPPPDPVAVGEGIEPGTFHIDIPWNGEMRRVDAAAGGWVTDKFHNFLIAAVDESGADPFAFDVRFRKQNGDFLALFQPAGVILGGETFAAVTENTSAYHGNHSDVRSYATFAGDEPDGFVSLSEVFLDSESVSCRLVTITEGRGKNKTTRQEVQVSGDIRVTAASSTGAAPAVWIETHFVDVTDPTAPVFSSRRSYNSDGIHSTSIQATLIGSFPVTSLGFREFHFTVDYVYPIGTNWSYAYDPRQNSDNGFETEWLGPATQVGDLWPLALAPEIPIGLTCK